MPLVPSITSATPTPMMQLILSPTPTPMISFVLLPIPIIPSRYQQHQTSVDHYQTIIDCLSQEH